MEPKNAHYCVHKNRSQRWRREKRTPEIRGITEVRAEAGIICTRGNKLLGLVWYGRIPYPGHGTSRKIIKMKITVFWNIASRSLVEIDRRFRDAYYLHHEGDETSVNFYQTTRRNNPEDVYTLDSVITRNLAKKNNKYLCTY
jgi:hypothetical protein